MDESGQHKSLQGIFAEAFTEWMNDRASRLAAAVAYYAIFSIGPLLMISLYLIGLFYGTKAANDQLKPQLAQFLNEQGADFVQELVAKIGVSPTLSFSGLVSLCILLYAATNLFVAIQDALNAIFNVRVRDKRGIVGVVVDRLFSIFMILLSGIFILGSIAVTTVISALSGRVHTLHPFYFSMFISCVNFVLSTALFTLVFATIFKFLPDIRVRLRDTLVGAATAALMFTLARFGLAYYLGRSSTTGPFGAAGSLVVVMLFVYYSAQILFFGAEFTQVWAKYRGVPIVASHDAVAVEEREISSAEEAQRASAEAKGPSVQASDTPGHDSDVGTRDVSRRGDDQRPNQWGGTGESSASRRSTNSTPT